MQERPASPDLFSSSDSSQQTPQDTEELTNIFDDEWVSDNNEEYYGTSMSDLYRKNSPWNYYTPQLCPSRHHTVIFEMPATLNHPPKPHYSSNTSHWDSNHVRMPFSSKNIFPVKENKQTVLKPRWDIIKRSLSQPIMSSEQLEAAIFSYNLRHKKFEALHHFFEEVLDDEESKHFFDTLLPQIVQLALQLPELIQTPIPLLKQGKPHTVSLSQLQIASLLANAFLCTFPWKKECYTYPGINFNRLYECLVTCEPSISEKLKCFIHYFRCVCNETPKGVVTFERKHLPRTQLPRWDKNESNIGDIKLHVTHTGTIESDGKGCLQVDFANCMIGGGVLGYGCVQEEIRFAICPELLVSRLFTEQLSHNEALLIIGPVCYSAYTGYASTFEWAGNHYDETPYDEYGRRRTSILAIDALLYFNTAVQFRPSKVIRELNKAYVGFHELSSAPSFSLSPVATGNWGCGAFRGNHHLKALIQIMACAAARRNIVYYTFGAKDLQSDVFNIYNFLATNSVTVAQLWRYLCQFAEAGVSSRQLLPFIKQAHLDSINNTIRDRTKITHFLTKKTPNKMPSSGDDTKHMNSNCFKTNFNARPLDSVHQSNNRQDTNESVHGNTNKNLENTQPSTSKWLPPQNLSQEITADEDIIEPSQDDKPDLLNFTHKMNSRNESKLSNCKAKHTKALSVLISSDEDSDDEKKCEGFLTTLDKLNTSIDLPMQNTSMDVQISSDESLMEVCVTNGVDNDENTTKTEKSVEENTAQYNKLNVVTKKKTPMKISDYFVHLK